MVPVPGIAAFLRHCPAIKGICAQATPAHLGLLRTQRHSESGTNAPVCAWPRCRRKRGWGRSVNGPPSCPAHASSSKRIPSALKCTLPPRPCTLPPRPWLQICPALKISHSGLGFTAAPCALLHVGNQCPEKRLSRGWRRLGLGMNRAGPGQAAARRAWHPGEIRPCWGTTQERQALRSQLYVMGPDDVGGAGGDQMQEPGMRLIGDWV